MRSLVKAGIIAAAGLAITAAAAEPRVKVAGGALTGTVIPGDQPVEAFLGVPYAAPPVGPLRWKSPQPAARWRGLRTATAFGARCMQQSVFADMMFRSPDMSEDCLTLNIWRPVGTTRGARLPVLFYIHGGGAVAGGGSERRYDGAALARAGIVVVTINYRLGVFGFFATPELAAEGGGAAGNYGLLDQAAALAWVRRNASAFGGDPSRITIGGESAGSMSVSVLMTSPLTRDLFARAIGESGGVLPPTFHPKPLAQAAAEGQALAGAAGAPTLEAMRALPADRLLAIQGEHHLRAEFIVDGKLLTETPLASYAAGRVARVPLLVGTNTQEGGWQGLLHDRPPTLANYRTALDQAYGAGADTMFALYPANSDADVPAAAMAVASDAFLAASTWSWFDAHRRLGAPTFLYQYAHVRPAALPPLPPSDPALGAVHSAEIEYALGNLDVNPLYRWTEEDRQVSATLRGYFTSFIKTGDPNAPGLPRWTAAPAGDGPLTRQRVDVDTRAVPFPEAARYPKAIPIFEAAPAR